MVNPKESNLSRVAREFRRRCKSFEAWNATQPGLDWKHDRSATLTEIGNSWHFGETRRELAAIWGMRLPIAKRHHNRHAFGARVPRTSSKNASERYDRLAEEFHREHRMLAPGKDRAFDDGIDEAERMATWQQWLIDREEDR